MRLPKKITRIMACMLSGAIAAGPAFSAQSVYRVYVPGLQPTSAPVSASSLITATPSSAQLSAEVGSSSYADISLTASAPSALSFDTASLPPSIQLVSNTCSSSNSTQACAVRVLYSPLTPESATYPLKWTSETQSGQIMLELAATPQSPRSSTPSTLLKSLGACLPAPCPQAFPSITGSSQESLLIPIPPPLRLAPPTKAIR